MRLRLMVIRITVSEIWVEGGGCWRGRSGRYRFSAFWLRSSVVSVLISLISDTSSIRGHYIKCIFGAGRWNRSLLRPLHASTRYCSTSGNGAPPRGKKLWFLKEGSSFACSLILLAVLPGQAPRRLAPT
uniref:Uncharacterized protein n=1 Tax=Myotis myotis TaxID=51298 RepID=A0A7J7T5R3_MYOMY|nr:hypothetical protein mMyoMyo1_009179 [Myotis myotis]